MHVSGGNAVAAAERFGIRAVALPKTILADPDISIVVNLTVPEAHGEINRAALMAGKHVYCEKPLALALGEVQELAWIARDRGLMPVCAPDTLFGSGMQSCRQALDQGTISVARFAAMELGMHMIVPRYYRESVGPLLDMVSYFVVALAALLGPVRSVAALGVRSPPRSAAGARGPVRSGGTRAGGIVVRAAGSDVSGGRKRPFCGAGQGPVIAVLPPAAGLPVSGGVKAAELPSHDRDPISDREH